MQFENTLLLPILLAIFAGAMLPLQGAINSQLGTSLNSTLLASTISFAVGFFTIALVFVFTEGASFSVAGFAQTKAIMYIGGILGVIFVTTVIYAVPKIGVASTMVSVIVGQLVLSAIVDHFSIFGVTARSLDLPRVMGLFFVIVGAVLIYE